MRDRTEDVRLIVDQYDGFQFIPLRLEDAFDPSWWAKVGGNPGNMDLGVDVTNEGTSSDIVRF